MGIFSWLSGIFDEGSSATSVRNTHIEGSASSFLGDTSISGLSSSMDSSAYNPASGLPMVGGIGGVDVGGNMYGTDSSHHSSLGSSNDSFSSGSSFDDW